MMKTNRIYRNFGKNYTDKLERICKGQWFVYVLECEGGFYYIGIAFDVQKRFKKHLIGNGAIFTKIHKPIRILAIIKTFTNDKGMAGIFENQVFREYVRRFGFKNIGGGSYVNKRMPCNLKKMTNGSFLKKITGFSMQ